MESINNRILLIISEFGLNKNSFSKRIGLSNNGIIQNIVSGRRSKPSFDILQKIILSFEDIDAEWLLTGKGEMIKKVSLEENEGMSEHSISDNSSVIDSMMQKIVESGIEIGRLKTQVDILTEENKRLLDLINQSKQSVDLG